MRQATYFILAMIYLTGPNPTRSAHGQETKLEPRVKKTFELDDVPAWLAEHDFKQDEFTFVRIRYDAIRGRSRWATDFPDAEWVLSKQLASMTTLRATNPKVLRLDAPELKQYPFAYLTEGGSCVLSEAEIKGLREYLLGGGFLLADDFWGEAEWEHFRSEMRRVFPNRQPKELPLSHPLFHCVFDFDEKPQVLSIHAFLSGMKTERPDATKPHYRAIMDDEDRIMVLACHNTDLADGWERAGDQKTYTEEVSKKLALPMGINILFTALSNARVD